MKKVILLKIGGSVITDKSKPYSLKKSILKRFAKELKAAKTPMVIAHGTGSFGHPSAKKYLNKDTAIKPTGISRVAYDTLKINEIITKYFVDEGLPVISLHPMSLSTASENDLKQHFYQTIDLTLKNDCIPLLHGDLIWNEKKGITIFSSEKILSLIALYLQKNGYEIDKIIYVGKTDGVLDKKGKTIPEITPDNWKSLQTNIGQSEDIDVTGGMKHKVEEALLMTNFGIEIILLNGNIKNNLTKALNNIVTEKTTLIKQPS